MNVIDQQVRQRQRVAAQVLRQRLRESAARKNSNAVGAEPETDARRIGLSLFCDAFFELEDKISNCEDSRE